MMKQKNPVLLPEVPRTI